MTKKIVNAIYVMASELFPLSPGRYTPEIVGFERQPIWLEKAQNGASLTVTTSDGSSVTLVPGDTLRLGKSGEGCVIRGPWFYNDRIRRTLASSTISQKILEYSDDTVEVDSDYNEIAKVLRGNNSWATASSEVPAKVGKLVIVYELLSAVDRARYMKFVVRTNAKHDPSVLEAIANIAARHQQLPSGAFDNAAKEQLEPWLLSAAKEYYARLAVAKIQTA